MPKDKPSRPIADRHDYLGNVLFHCDKALASLESAKHNLERAGADSRPLAAVNGAITSQMIVAQFARDERYNLRQQFDFGF